MCTEKEGQTRRELASEKEERETKRKRDNQEKRPRDTQEKSPRKRDR